MRLKVPIQVALVGEAASPGDFGQRCAAGDQAARGRHAARDQIAMRRASKAAAEGAGEAEAVEIGDALEIGGFDRARELGIEKVANPQQRAMRCAGGKFAKASLMSPARTPSRLTASATKGRVRLPP